MPDKVYFRKALVSNPVFVNGAPVPFERLSGNVGVGAYDPEKDKLLIEGLTILMNTHKGGITLISRDVYEDLKKKRSLATSAKSSQQNDAYRVMPSAQSYQMPSPLRGKGEAADPAAGAARLPGSTAPSAPPLMQHLRAKAETAPPRPAPSLPKGSFKPKVATPTAQQSPAAGAP